mmetsp:Transcript_13103/g.21715  ORF Transcript_13103/g.21715 Transcript_13103/m.21715 type:complete len:205 (+) Transcript_13103:543-1157(+)
MSFGRRRNQGSDALISHFVDKSVLVAVLLQQHLDNIHQTTVACLKQGAHLLIVLVVQIGTFVNQELGEIDILHHDGVHQQVVSLAIFIRVRCVGVSASLDEFRSNLSKVTLDGKLQSRSLFIIRHCHIGVGSNQNLDAIHMSALSGNVNSSDTIDMWVLFIVNSSLFNHLIELLQVFRSGTSNVIDVSAEINQLLGALSVSTSC